MTRNLDFLLIGVPRAGTTSLFHYLRGHDSIYVPIEKEVPYFSDSDRLANGWDRFYAEFFRKASQDAVIGKLTPQYWGNPGVVDELARSMPDIKLLVALRNPVDRAYSHYTLSFRDEEEQTKPFEEVMHAHSDYLPLGEYGRILHELLSVFDRQQVLVFFTDELQQDPGAVLDRVLHFLGLEQGYRPANMGKQYNQGGTSKNFGAVARLLKRNPVTFIAWKLIPLKLRRLLKLWYKSEMATKKTTDQGQAMPAAVRAQLVEHYREDIGKLEALLGQRVPWSEFSQEPHPSK